MQYRTVLAVTWLITVAAANGIESWFPWNLAAAAPTDVSNSDGGVAGPRPVDVPDVAADPILPRLLSNAALVSLAMDPRFDDMPGNTPVENTDAALSARDGKRLTGFLPSPFPPFLIPWYEDTPDDISVEESTPAGAEGSALVPRRLTNPSLSLFVEGATPEKAGASEAGEAIAASGLVGREPKNVYDFDSAPTMPEPAPSPTFFFSGEDEWAVVPEDLPEVIAVEVVEEVAEELSDLLPNELLEEVPGVRLSKRAVRWSA